MFFLYSIKSNEKLALETMLFKAQFMPKICEETNWNLQSAVLQRSENLPVNTNCVISITTLYFHTHCQFFRLLFVA